MLRMTCATVLLIGFLAPATATAQSPKAARKVAELMTEFNTEMRGYERELKYFQRVPAQKPLLELHNVLVAQAGKIMELDGAGKGTGPAILDLARQMDRGTRQLVADTIQFEKRTDVVGSGEARVIAKRMKLHSESMVRAVDRLIGMFR